jgi:hypothetical protein
MQIQNYLWRATQKRQLTSNSPVSPLSLLFGELKSSPLFRLPLATVSVPSAIADGVSPDYPSAPAGGTGGLLRIGVEIRHFRLGGPIGTRIRGGEVHLLCRVVQNDLPAAH